MPKMMDMPEEGEMDSLYASGEPQTKEPAAASEEKGEELEESNTAIVPMKLLQGKSSEPIKEGEEIVVKAVKVYGDEVEIAYSETKPSAIGGGEKSADQEIDEMSSANPGSY